MERQVEVFHRRVNDVVGKDMLAEHGIHRVLDDLLAVAGERNNAQLRLLAGDKNIARLLDARGKQQRAGYGQRHIRRAAGIGERLFEGDRAQAGSRIEHDDLTVLEIRSHLYSDGIVIVLRENQKDELTALDCLLHIGSRKLYLAEAGVISISINIHAAQLIEFCNGVLHHIKDSGLITLIGKPGSRGLSAVTCTYDRNGFVSHVCSSLNVDSKMTSII